MQTEQEVSDIVQRHIRHHVGRAALKKAFQLVLRWNEEERQDRQLWRATLIALLIVLALGAGYLLTLERHATVVAGNELPRPAAAAH